MNVDQVRSDGSSHSDAATEETTPHASPGTLLLLLLGGGVLHLVLLVVLVGGDLVGKHAAAGHVRLGVVDIGNDLDRRVIEAALLRLIVVVGLRLRRLERGCSLRVGGASRGDR